MAVSTSAALGFKNSDTPREANLPKDIEIGPWTAKEIEIKNKKRIKKEIRKRSRPS